MCQVTGVTDKIDPIADNKCEQVQFGGSWRFCASGLGWRIRREEA